MSSLDEIKKKLNIDELDKETRNNMFNKFVEKGGKVIKEETKKNAVSINRNAHKEANEKVALKNEELRKKRYNYKQKIDENNLKNKKTRKYLSTYFNGIFQGIFSFSNKFSKKFSESLQIDLNEILSSLNYFTGFILNLEGQKKIDIIEKLNKDLPNSIEIIMRIYNLYKINSILKIQNFSKKSNNIICTEIIDDIRILFRELLLLYPFWESVKETLWRGFTVYQDLTETKETLLPRFKLNKYIDMLFGYYFPAFHIILNYNLGIKLPFEFRLLYENSGFTGDEEMGCFTTQINEEKRRYLEQIEVEKEERKKILQDSIEKKELEKIPKYIQKGLSIIDSLIEKIPLKIKDDNNAKLLEPNEKMMQFYILFKEFDKDYSFILTTSQIKLSPRSISGKRIDIKSEFDELNIKLNEINSFTKEYFSIMEQYVALKEEFKNTPLVSQQKSSVLYTKRVQTLNEIRVRSINFFRRFAITLQKIINDYNEEKLLLQNGDDLLVFEHEIGARKKFENMAIIKAIAAAFTFSSAMHYYITVDKLSTKSLFLDDRKKNEDLTKNEEETTK
jgi:hypothetical protein